MQGNLPIIILLHDFQFTCNTKLILMQYTLHTLELEIQRKQEWKEILQPAYWSCTCGRKY